MGAAAASCCEAELSSVQKAQVPPAAPAQAALVRSASAAEAALAAAKPALDGARLVPAGPEVDPIAALRSPAPLPPVANGFHCKETQDQDKGRGVKFTAEAAAPPDPEAELARAKAAAASLRGPKRQTYNVNLGTDILDGTAAKAIQEKMHVMNRRASVEHQAHLARRGSATPGHSCGVDLTEDMVVVAGASAEFDAYKETYLAFLRAGIQDQLINSKAKAFAANDQTLMKYLARCGDKDKALEALRTDIQARYQRKSNAW